MSVTIPEVTIIPTTVSRDDPTANAFRRLGGDYLRQVVPAWKQDPAPHCVIRTRTITSRTIGSSTIPSVLLGVDFLRPDGTPVDGFETCVELFYANHDQLFPGYPLIQLNIYLARGREAIILTSHVIDTRTEADMPPRHLRLFDPEQMLLVEKLVSAAWAAIHFAQLPLPHSAS